jgi:hypothetical protein
MRLHHAVDLPEGPGPDLTSTLFRRFADSAAGRRFPWALDRWPTLAGHRPVFRALYFLLMNLAVLCLFRQGVSEHQSRSE